MITPGIAGSVVILISNTAFTQFGISAKWCSLTLSFLLGALVFAGTLAPLWQKAIFYLLNSAIIFAVAVGTNQVGTRLTEPHPGTMVWDAPSSSLTDTEIYAEAKPRERPWFHDWFRESR